jgi:hypothetical protein
MDELDLKTGPCPFKQTDRHDCYFHLATGPVLCNWKDFGAIRRTCHRYYRMAELHDLMPELWSGDTCCSEYRHLMLRCAESGGFAAGCIDARRYPNDGKDVWRNYLRVRLAYCPFCGAKQGAIVSPPSEGDTATHTMEETTP